MPTRDNQNQIQKIEHDEIYGVKKVSPFVDNGDGTLVRQGKMATEAKQDAIIAAIENQTPPAGGATEAKQDDIITAVGTVSTNVQGNQPRDVSKLVTPMTVSLAASGNVKVPASGKKLRVYSINFSLSADMTDVSFRFTSGGSDFSKFLAPKSGGYYGKDGKQRYYEGAIDQALYCVITGTGNVQINIDYLEI